MGIADKIIELKQELHLAKFHVMVKRPNIKDMLANRERIQTALMGFGPRGEEQEPREGRIHGPLFKYRYDMTRGNAYAFFMKDKKIHIRATDQWNGDMYPGGHFEDLVVDMMLAKTEEDFGFAMHKFNQEHHAYSEFDITSCSLREWCEEVPEALKSVTRSAGRIKLRGGGSQGVNVQEPCIDFNEGYFKLWFADYIFFKNYTDSQIHFIIDGESRVFQSVLPGQVITFCFGESPKVFATLDDMPEEAHGHKNLNWSNIPLKRSQDVKI